MKQRQTLPVPTRDLETAKNDLSKSGYCVIEEAIPVGQPGAMQPT